LEIRTILDCDPVGECMGFLGDCGDIQNQFLTVQGPYVYGDPPEEHMYLDEYICTQFPDDAYVTDQLLVGLISVAVALPVDLFLARAFELANENSDMPESWVDEVSGNWKFVVGKNAHNSWRLADPKQPVSDLVLWLVRYSSYEPLFSSLIRLLGWLKRKIRERLFGKKEEAEEDDDGAGTSASAEARAEAIQKRLYASMGLIGVYLCWTIFSWFICAPARNGYRGPLARADASALFITLSQSRTECSSTRRSGTRRNRSSPRLGVRLLCLACASGFRLLIRSCPGIGYGMDNATEWQEVLKTAAKTALILVVLDMLRLSKNADWFEEHVDFVSMQAVLFNGAAKNWWAQTRTLVRLQARLTED
jgi:hypothetical protein